MASDLGELKRILLARIERLSNKAIESDGHLSVEDIEEIDRLAKLTELSERMDRDVKRTRWPLVVALLGGLVIISLLFFRHVNETDIELDFRLSEVTFSLSDEHVMFQTILLEELGVFGLQEIHLPKTMEEPADTIVAFNGIGSDINLSASVFEGTKGTITLNSLRLPEQSKINLQVLGESECQLILWSDVLNLETNIRGPVRISVPGVTPPRQYISSDSEVPFFKPASDQIGLHIHLADSNQQLFVTPVAVHGLDLSSVQELSDDESIPARRISSVISGTIYLESLNGLERKLRPAEELRFRQSRGVIRELKLNGGQILLRFRGRVSGMTVGLGTSERPLMPTYLEWLQARHGLKLFWGAILYLFTVSTGFYRWWRRP